MPTTDKEIFENIVASEPRAEIPDIQTPNVQPVTAEELVSETVAPPFNPHSPDQSEPVPVIEVRRGRGRHPKGCTCGRCKQSEGSPSVIGSPDTTALPQPITEAGTDYLALSGFIFDTTTHALATGFGDEWLARTPDERKNVCGNLAAYLKSKEVKDIPPGMMLTIALCAYSAPRLKSPSTAAKIKAGFVWLKTKLTWKRGK